MPGPPFLSGHGVPWVAEDVWAIGRVWAAGCARAAGLLMRLSHRVRVGCWGVPLWALNMRR